MDRTMVFRQNGLQGKVSGVERKDASFAVCACHSPTGISHAVAYDFMIMNDLLSNHTAFRKYLLLFICIPDV